VDDTYDPSTISGPVWLMYDRTTDSGETEGDVYQLESQFKVIDAEGYDGEPVSNAPSGRRQNGIRPIFKS